MKPHKKERKVWVYFPDRKGKLRSKQVPRKSGTLVKLGPVDKPVKTERRLTSRPGRKGRMVRTVRPRGGSISGAMQFRFLDILGIRTIWDDGFPPYEPPVHIELRVPAMSDNLYDLVSVRNGDHKHPNRQQFLHEVTNDYQGYFRTDYPGRSAGVTGFPSVAYNPLVYTPRFSETAFNDALSKMFESFRGDIDLSIDLAEMHKSNSMISKAFKGIIHLGTTLRKMRRSNPRDWGNLWLEFTYGWKPLAQDIYGALDRLLDPSKQSSWYIAKGRGYDQDHASADVSQSGVVYTLHQRADIKYRCLMQCRMRFDHSVNEQLAGYTSLNPVSIAWELVPYSFVVDWFVNVGGYLRNLESVFLYHRNFVDGFVTEGVLDQNLAEGIGTKYRDDGVTKDEAVFKGSFKGTRKRRQVLTELPLPYVPVFKPKLGSSRLLSAAALLGQQLKSLKH